MEKRDLESNINPYAGKSAVEVDRTAMDAMDGGNGNGYVEVESNINPYAGKSAVESNIDPF